MAAGLFNAKLRGGRSRGHSAGAIPSALLRDEAITVMQEVGIDLQDEFPKPISPEIEEVVDIIVTLDAHDEIPILDGKRYLAWRLPPFERPSPGRVPGDARRSRRASPRARRRHLRDQHRSPRTRGSTRNEYQSSAALQTPRPVHG